MPFTWTSVAGAQGYRLIVGTTVYGDDLFDSGILAPTVTNSVVPALPTGKVLDATVFTETGGTWVNVNMVGFTAS